jgi:hypothetical protein
MKTTRLAVSDAGDYGKQPENSGALRLADRQFRRKRS